MNIEHLRYVIEVERAGSISQAAENLYMAQPNLSKAIKELEQALNIKLFQRTSKGAVITAKGREFLRYAKGILQQYEEMEALGRENAEDEQSLRISVPRASYIVDAFTSLLCQLDPEKPMRLELMETNALRVVRHVADLRAPLGVIRLKSEYLNYFLSLLKENGLAWRTLMASRYLLLVSRSHPLAERGEVALEQLEPYIEIIHGDTALPHMQDHETERGMTPGDKKVRVYERGSQFDILARVPGSYMWVSPMPEDLLLRNGLVQKMCGQAPDFLDIVIHPEGCRFTDLEQLFLTELERSAARVVEAAGR